MKEKVVNLRYKYYNNTWNEFKIGSITDSFSGGTPNSSNKNYYSGEIPFIRSGEIKFTVTELFISREALESSSAKLVNKGDILYALYGATSGEVAISKMDGAINQAILALRPKEGFDSKFLESYLVKEKQNILDKYLQGGQGNLSGSIIKNISLSIPDYTEQQSVGSLFHVLDDLLLSYKENLANYQAYKATMLSKMFPKAGQKEPEIRLDGFEGEWETDKLSNLAIFSKGNSYTKNDLTENGLPIILYGQLYTNYQSIIKNVETYVQEYKTNSVLSKGSEVIVPASGETSEDISRASVVLQENIILGGDLNVITVNKEKVDSLFLALTISNGSQQKELIRRAQGKSVVHLRNSDLMKVILLFPSIVEQQAIGEFFLNIDDIIVSYKDKISEMENLKKKLLKEMFI